MSALTVNWAVYGALAGGNENSTQAIDITNTLQNAINATQGIVKIDNSMVGQDPSKGNTKHFGASVSLDGVAQVYACQEGQTIDFYHWLAPTTQE